MEAAWLDRFLGLLPPCPSVLDIGCGSGEPIALYLAERGCKVTGIDSAPEMIAIYQDNLPQQSWGVADMRSLSLGRSFHGILAWDSFFSPLPGRPAPDVLCLSFPCGAPCRPHVYQRPRSW